MLMPSNSVGRTGPRLPLRVFIAISFIISPSHASLYHYSKYVTVGPGSLVARDDTSYLHTIVCMKADITQQLAHTRNISLRSPTDTNKS